MVSVQEMVNPSWLRTIFGRVISSISLDEVKKWITAQDKNAFKEKPKKAAPKKATPKKAVAKKPVAKKK